jgi:hypothetical protein
MPRYSIITSTGRTIAKGVYHLTYLPLIGCHDRQTLVPAGSFIVDCDLARSGWTTHPQSGIYLCHQDVFDFPRTERYQGCCGPDGDYKNVLDPDTMEPIAYEFADCWNAHYIRLARGDYDLREESSEEPKCFVGYVEYRGERQLVGAACGRTEKEALARLMPLCQKQRDKEAGCTSQHYQIVHLEINTQEASRFLTQLHRDKPKWLFLKY